MEAKDKETPLSPQQTVEQAFAKCTTLAELEAAYNAFEEHWLCDWMNPIFNLHKLRIIKK